VAACAPGDSWDDMRAAAREYHLYKIVPKAGVSSRTELARLVLTQDPG
jgi:hypothetical protein